MKITLDSIINMIIGILILTFFLSLLMACTSCSMIKHEAQRKIEQATIKTIDNNIEDIVKKQLDEQLPKATQREVRKTLPEALPKAIEHGISNWVWNQLSTKGIIGLLASLFAFLGFKGIKFHIHRRMDRKKTIKK